MLLEAAPPPQGACTKLLFVCRGHSQAAEEKGVTESLGLSICLSSPSWRIWPGCGKSPGLEGELTPGLGELCGCCPHGAGVASLP